MAGSAMRLQASCRHLPAKGPLLPASAATAPPRCLHTLPAGPMNDGEVLGNPDSSNWKSAPSGRGSAAQNKPARSAGCGCAQAVLLREQCAQLQAENAQLLCLLAEERTWAAAMAASRSKERESAQRRAVAAQAAAARAADERDAAKQRAAAAEESAAAAEQRVAAAEAAVAELRRQLEAATAQLAGPGRQLQDGCPGEAGS